MKYFILFFFWACTIVNSFAQVELEHRTDLSKQNIVDAVCNAAPYTLYRKGMCLEYVMSDGESVLATFRETVQDVQVKNGLYEVSVLSSYLTDEDEMKPASMRTFREFQVFTTGIDVNGTYLLTHNLLHDKYPLKIKERNGFAVAFPAIIQEGDRLVSGTINDKIAGGIGNGRSNATYSDVIVCGKEKVTTPAGTFNCVKITGSFYQEARYMKKHKIKYNFTWWYAKGLGLVRSEVSDEYDNETILAPFGAVIYLNCINPNY